MTREEAIARGIEVHETEHSMKRRSPWHDYSRKGTYMVTLVVEGRKPLLGKLRTKPSGKAMGAVVYVPSAFPKVKGAVSTFGQTTGVVAYVELTALGRAIETEEKQKITRFYPMVEVWKLCLMPDHIHMILRVKEDMPNGKTLGSVIRGFKTGCSRAWWRLTPLGETKGTELAYGKTGGAITTFGKTKGTAATFGKAKGTVASGAIVPSGSPEVRRPVLFEAGYNDKILLREGQLDNWKAYLDDNPRRLWMKQQHPQLFTILHDMEIAGRNCQIVGNRFLLDIPDKVAVIVHRRYTDEENARLREEWLSCGERGGVLVSAAISQKEKEVLREAMNRGYRIILLRENGFPQLYKPLGESFNACSAGLLLQISPWEYHMERKAITRTQCLELNEMAEKIASCCVRQLVK